MKISENQKYFIYYFNLSSNNTRITTQAHLIILSALPFFLYRLKCDMRSRIAYSLNTFDLPVNLF